MDALRWDGFNVWGRIGLVISLSLLAIQVDADEYAYKPSEKYAVQPLKQGEKWQTDEVLRKGMDNILHAVIASQDGIEKERFSSQDYQ